MSVCVRSTRASCVLATTPLGLRRSRSQGGAVHLLPRQSAAAHGARAAIPTQHWSIAGSSHNETCRPSELLLRTWAASQPRGRRRSPGGTDGAPKGRRKRQNTHAYQVRKAISVPPWFAELRAWPSQSQAKLPHPLQPHDQTHSGFSILAGVKAPQAGLWHDVSRIPSAEQTQSLRDMARHASCCHSTPATCPRICHRRGSQWNNVVFRSQFDIRALRVGKWCCSN
eukprot:COSAG06_NODE_492_length_15074_cov_26.658564_4_plen_226_part_00